MITYRKNVDPGALDPAFRVDIEELLGGSPYSWLVTFGTRTLAEQADLWAKYQAGGPKAAPPGKSAHNYGLAVDVVLDGDAETPGIQADWDTTHQGWLSLFEAIWQHPRLHSGRSFQDADHIERLNWKSHIPGHPANLEAA